MFKDEFLESMPTPTPTLYTCDPHKHWVCNKSGCVFNLDIPETARVCDSTIHIEFKWDGVSERVGHYGNSRIVIRRANDG